MKKGGKRPHCQEGDSIAQIQEPTPIQDQSSPAYIALKKTYPPNRQHQESYDDEDIIIARPRISGYYFIQKLLWIGRRAPRHHLEDSCSIQRHCHCYPRILQIGLSPRTRMSPCSCALNAHKLNNHQTMPARVHPHTNFPSSPASPYQPQYQINQVFHSMPPPFTNNPYCLCALPPCKRYILSCQ